MILKKELDTVSKRIIECDSKDALIFDFLSKIKERAADILSGAETIVLVGATPFAKNVMNNRMEYLPEKTVVLVDEFNEKDQISGALYILCSRPNVEKHIGWIKEIDGSAKIIMYQLLLTLYPDLSIDPYAYQYE